VKPAVVIVGGTGVFGGRLARRLIQQDAVRVIVAGRDAHRLKAFCDAYGGEPLQLDRNGDIAVALTAIAPFAIVDAAGPFQDYGDDPYRLARAAIGLGSHYLDLSDDAVFTAGIASLDADARAAGVAVLSGVSSVPTISAAAVRSLMRGLVRIDSIDSVILPGNRAPRGLSVVQAIVSQVGRPLRLFRGGRWTDAPAWSGLRRLSLAVPGVRPLGRRWASFIGAPDLLLFPAAFAARSVTFRAGLELAIMHLGLWSLSWLVRGGLLSRLRPLAGVLHTVAGWLERWGSDRGGMRVSVLGIDADGHRLRREWTLIAEAGAGPEIPAIPAFVLLSLLRRQVIATGARPCLDAPTLEQLEAALPTPAMRTHRTETPAPVLYERILGDAFGRLPPVLQALHAVVDQTVSAGRAQVDVGQHPLARLIAWLMRFPPAAADVAVSVTMRVEGNRERWVRRFGSARFESVLRQDEAAAPGALVERFGPFSFDVQLVTDGTCIKMPVSHGRFLGIPLPSWLTPESRTREFVDAQGRAGFDVEIVLPRIGRLVRYRGALEPLLDDARPLPA
jgi:hypothetical protein